MSEIELLLEHIKEIERDLNESGSVPSVRSDYGEGYRDCLSYIREYITDELGIETDEG